MDWLSGDMKGRYCSMRLNKYTEERDPWPPIKTKSYVTLALVYQRELQTAQKTTATIYLRTKGDIDKIPQTIDATKLTDIAQIFDPLSDRVPNIILIEGHAGIGKTTLVKQVCKEWAEGKLLTSDKLVLLLLLRDPNVQKITDGCKLIEHFTDYSTTELYEELVKNHGADITLIIDGFDELSTELRQYSFFRKLIEKTALPKAKIVVTSRPSASACLHHVVDKRIEILGFEQSSKGQYVIEALQNSPSKLEKLQRHFQQYPNIDAICYIPLIMSIIIFLCICQPDKLPPTATKMYESFILHMICHYLRRVGKFPKDKIVNKVEDFSPTIHAALQQLEKTAFDGLVEDKIVFTVEELPALCKDDPTCYGLLQSTECYSAQEVAPTQSFNFLHLGIQEYFAAKYVTSLLEDKVYTLLKESFIVTNRYRVKSVRLSNMWILYCGITKGQCKALRYCLATYSGALLPHSLPDHFDQRISTSEIISQYVLKDRSNVLYLFQCFQEAQDTALCKDLSKSFDSGVIDISDHSLLPHQVVSLGYFLSKSDRKKFKELNLSKCHIGDHGMSILHKYLCRDKTSKQEITEINLSENNLTGASSPLIADIITHLQIHTLLLHNNNITNVRDISTAVITSSTVKVLNLADNGITAQDSVAIFDIMICLEKFYISNFGAEVLSKGIINTKTLRILHINNIGISKIIAITNALVNNTSLEEVNLNKLAIRIIRTLHLNNTIINFGLPNMAVSVYSDMVDISENSFLPYQMEYLGFFLSQSHHSKWNLSKCHIGDHGMSILHQYLCKDKANKLEMLEINLSENDLTGASSPLIVDIISHLQVYTLLLCNNNTNVRDISTAVITSSTLKVLDLGDNGITAEEVKVICDMMICLEELYISSKLYNRKLNINCSTNKLGDSGAELLSKGITNTKTLRVLHIADNNIGPSGITAIVNALVNNTSLEELNLNNNKVGKDGAIVIAKAITNNKTLKTLLLNNFYTMDEEESAMIILMSLQHNNTITRVEFADISVSFDYGVIDVSAHSLLPPQVDSLGLFLSNFHHRKWKEFNLSACHIGDHGMSILHQYLCGNRANKLEITEINLSENNLTGASSLPVADIITHLQVHVLWLHNNDITNVRDISTAVIASSTLKVLSFNDNYITAQEAVAISDMMICLEEFYISSKINNKELDIANKLVDCGAELLSKGIANTKTLRVLHIANNNIGPSGAIAIANALVNNTSLEELNMNHNNVGQDGAIAIAKAITINNTLKKLLLCDDSKIDKESAMTIMRNLHHNNTIIELELPDISCCCNAVKEELIKINVRRNECNMQELVLICKGF